MEKDTRVELTEERVREIVREELRAIEERRWKEFGKSQRPVPLKGPPSDAGGDGNESR